MCVYLIDGTALKGKWLELSSPQSAEIKSIGNESVGENYNK